MNLPADTQISTKHSPHAVSARDKVMIIKIKKLLY